MEFGVIKNSEMSPWLSSLSQVRPNHQKTKWTAMTALMLTSLVDVFSILVIYLLVNASASKHNIQLDKPIVLPKATQSTLIESGIKVEIVKGNYIINDQVVARNELLNTMKALVEDVKKKNEKARVILQADQNESFEMINPILLLSGELGYDTLQFATVQTGGGE